MGAGGGEFWGLGQVGGPREPWGAGVTGRGLQGSGGLGALGGVLGVTGRGGGGAVTGLCCTPTPPACAVIPLVE